MNCYVYILKCNDGSLYVGSTKYLELRVEQHAVGMGSNFTRKRLPVELVYTEEFTRIDDAFNREQQIKKWSRTKKLALIKKDYKTLKKLAKSKRH